MENDFLNELEEEIIHLRDNLQVELKSEFELSSKSKKDIFAQEFYIFIPESLQISSQTYPKEQFYKDETNLVRYKTPIFSFDELLNPANLRSPLYRLRSLAKKMPFQSQQEIITEEGKLFGNIFRSTLRDKIADIIQGLKKESDKEHKARISRLIDQLLENIARTRSTYLSLQKELIEKSKDPIISRNLHFIDEFLCDTIDYFMSGFLDFFRSTGFASLATSDKKICDLILEEKNRKNLHYPPSNNHPHEKVAEEAQIYRQSLLQKFLLESLQLKSSRIAVIQKHGPLIGAIAAGIAMFVYMVLFLFAWQRPTLLINSIPFVISVVFFYILKDRVKEGLKSYYMQRAFRWFPDYRTEIFSQRDKPIGVLTESVSFISQSQVPTRIQKIRNEDSHDNLDKLQRHEAILFYKREVKFYQNSQRETARRHHINTLFRFNLRRFLEKASDPTTLRFDLDPKTLKILHKEMPKTYHLNIILKSIQMQANGEESSEIQKYRIIVDKTGIKRVEYLGRH